MDTERLLIVNADDYNTDPARNRGIIEAAKKGILTSASVLTNMPGLDDALCSLEQVLGSRIGVHLNLTRGIPLISGAQSLVGPQGDFLPKDLSWRKALLGGYKPDEIRREWGAQIEAFCRTGRQPNHLDGNNHLHIFPGCVKICAELALQYNIRCVRLPLEPLYAPGMFGRAGLKRFFMALLAVRARSLFRKGGLCSPERMFGIAFPDTGDPAELCCFFKKLPSGVSELMCHPGYSVPGAQSFSCADRERELHALTSLSVRKAIIAEKIRLISFNDMS